MRFSWITFLLFFSLQIVAQENLNQSLRALQENAILKEKVFIHTNKTSYFQDDTIWLKAYVADTINSPSIQTTKLYVNLLDEIGIVIYARNILIEKGIGLGQFELNNALDSGSYYIQAYTNHMRNFGDSYHYLQKIEVLGDTAIQVQEPNQNQYDVQVLPEGGHLLEGIENTIGIKALVNGLGTDFKGHIRTRNGKSIVSFESQHSGMTSCKFLYGNDEKYTAEIVLKDTVLTIQVPQANRKGLGIHLDNAENNYLKIYLKTNQETFTEDDFSNYSLLFHQNHRISDLFSLTRFDSLNGLLKMRKDLFFNGVNTVTLFEGENPIAERKFFIESEEKQTDIQLKRIHAEGDSISYTIALKNREKALEGDLSVSILSADSQMRYEEQNIQTAFLLTSFLKGHVENPSYYFNRENLKRKEHLDVLLLTQGWTQYSLPEMIENLNPKPIYKFEYGFNLRGQLEYPVEYDSIALIRDDFQIVKKVNLENDYSFAFSNLLLYRQDTTKVAFIDSDGKVIKPQKIVYDSLGQKDIPLLKIPFDKKYSLSSRFFQQDSNSTRTQIPKKPKVETTIITPDGTIALEEAIVTEKKRSKQYLERRKIIAKYKPIVSDIGRFYDIPIPEVYRNYDDEFLQYLRSQGNREVRDHSLNITYFLSPASREVIVFIDGKLILRDEVTGLNIRMSEIENLLVSSSGIINGKLVRTPIYQIFTKKKYGNQSIDLFNEHRVKNGYDKSKKYYSPIYTSERSLHGNGLEVDWKPSIKTNSKGAANFEIIKNQKSRSLLFSIQGFSKKGHLISETIRME